MISFPVNVYLTLAFGLAGFYGLFHLLSPRRRETTTGSRTLTDEQVVDVNHVIMSVAMILMTWLMIGDALLWMQVALFSVLALSLLPIWTRAGNVVDRVNVSGHILMDLAMIWMLAAMPQLMLGMSHGAGASHGDHGSHGSHGMEMTAAGGMELSAAATPAWADAVNGGVVAACVVVAAWWVVRLTKGPGHRWHSACHALMAAAMGVMLVAMNG